MSESARIEEEAMRENVHDALKEKTEQGFGAVVWRDGGVVQLSAAEVLIELADKPQEDTVRGNSSVG